ncbi:MAG: hypothetical protein Q8M11_15765 [Sulfuritalea sp.]|nr:hypothetical protein [Sulfuritalea sp.]MDP1981502.1 hypothetical protein [Sulfuritalea sp.]
MTLRWKVSLTAEARRDFANILHWTVDHFGKGQATAPRQHGLAASPSVGE